MQVIMFRGNSRLLNMAIVTLGACIIAEAGRIDGPDLTERENAGMFTWIFDKHTTPHCRIISSSYAMLIIPKFKLTHIFRSRRCIPTWYSRSRLECSCLLYTSDAADE